MMDDDVEKIYDDGCFWVCVAFPSTEELASEMIYEHARTALMSAGETGTLFMRSRS